MSRLNLGAITAYAIAKKYGFVGTEEEWLASLKAIVDSELSLTSTNSVQNKVVKKELDKKVEKYAGEIGLVRLYGVDSQNNNLMYAVGTSDASCISGRYPRYDSEKSGTAAISGYLRTNIPKNDYHCSNKKYVDDKEAQVYKHSFNVGYRDYVDGDIILENFYYWELEFLSTSKDAFTGEDAENLLNSFIDLITSPIFNLSLSFFDGGSKTQQYILFKKESSQLFAFNTNGGWDMLEPIFWGIQDDKRVDLTIPEYSPIAI